MSPEQKRQYVTTAYSGADWPSKVKKMSDKQVHVIYMRLIQKEKK